MMFNKAKQIAFLLPPKCGTHAVVDFFHSAGWHSLAPVHASLEWFEKKYKNLQNYMVYAFMRDPLFRFESALRHISRVNEVKFHSYDQMIDDFSTLSIKYKLMLFPQHHWISDPRVTPLDFDNLESELHRITETAFPVKQLNAAGDSWRSEITDKVRAFVREYYAADYALAKDRLGKEY